MLKVLILEDSADDAVLMLHELESAGLDVDHRQTATLPEFAALIETFAPDLVLADYRLPQFDGLKALEVLQQKAPKTPFILVSGCMGTELAAQLLHTSGTNYVPKDSLFRLGPVVKETLGRVDHPSDERLSPAQKTALRSIAIKRRQNDRDLYLESSEIRILILEDTIDAVRLLEAELTKNKLRYEGKAVFSEPEFRQALSKFKPDVILADFSLPSFDGLAALKLRNELAPGIPYIFVSSIVGEDDALELLKMGATDYVHKDRLPRLGPVVKRAVLDSHERKAFERNQEIMRAIMDKTSDAILTVNSTGVIQLANPAASEVFGMKNKGLLGLKLEDIVPAAVPKAFDQLCARAADDLDLELVGKRDNGQEFPIDFTLSRLQIDHEELFTAMIRDITERTKLRQQLQEQISNLETTNSQLSVARDKAQEASALKSMFVANISHEIRTPMSGVLGMSELLLLSDIDPEMKQMASHIYECSKSLVAIVNDILDFSKLEAGKVRLERLRFSLPSVLDQVLQTVSPAAVQKDLEIRLKVEESLPKEFYGDDGRIRQTLLNLAHNAIKFTPSGHVEIEVILVQQSKDVATVKFLVRDTGIGMSQTAMESLFVPFMQADNSMTRKYGGTGLGLSICKSLVTLMSGEIGVDSVEEKGSTFWVALPLELASLN